MKSPYFKASLAVAASGLAVSSGHAQLVNRTYDTTITPSSGTLDFGVVSPSSTDDYEILFAGYGSPNANKPQITSGDGGTSGPNLVFLNSEATDDGTTLPVLTAGTVVGPSLEGGVTRNQGYFYQNWNKNYYGDWAGTGGSNPPSPLVGPITGYVGLELPVTGSPGNFNYGYAEFTLNETLSTPTLELLSTTYDPTVNEAVTIPSVPEPTSVALLAAGATGLLALRRRRSLR